MIILTPVRELIGKDIKGVRANVTHPKYRKMYPNGVGRIRRLVRAEWRKKRGERWLYLLWQRDPEDRGDCGYSGWAEGFEPPPEIELLDPLDNHQLTLPIARTT